MKKYDVHAEQVTDWKTQLQDGAADIFGKGAQKSEATHGIMIACHTKIRRLTMENDLLESVTIGV